MSNWQGTLSKSDAILILEKLTDHDDPHWDCMVEDHYDEESDTWPSVYHFLAALGVTQSEYKDALGIPVERDIGWPQCQQQNGDRHD